MEKLYQTRWGYRLLKNYTLWGFRQFYGDITVIGTENIPVNDNTAIIFAPNHLNALMDALAVASLMPKPKTVFFLARADFFAKKNFARFLYSIKILPAFRMRDGIENLGKNQQSFDHSFEALKQGHAVCIMPEGGQGEERKIRPLVKGIFRLGFDAQLRFGSEKSVKIIPVGIDMGDLVKAGKHLIINIGEAISMEDYLELYNENQPQALNEIKDELHKRLSGLTLNLATSKHYDCFETACDVMAEELEDLDGTGRDYQTEKFHLKQQTARTLVDLEKNRPEVMDQLAKQCQKYKKLSRELKFKPSVFSKQDSDKISFKRLLALIITFPVALFGIVTNLLPTFAPVWLRKALKIDYEGFWSSVHFALGMLLIPLIYLAQTALFHLLIAPGWGISFIFLVLQYYTRRFSMKWYSNAVRYIHRFRFIKNLKESMQETNPVYQMITERNKIISTINKENNKV